MSVHKKGGGQSLPRKPSQSRIRSTALPRGELFCSAAKLPVSTEAFTRSGEGVEERSDETDEGAPADGSNGCSPLIRHFVPPSTPRGEGIDKTASNSIQGNGQKLPRKPSPSRIRSTALPRGELFCSAAKLPVSTEAFTPWGESFGSTAKLLVLPRALPLGELSPQVTERARTFPFQASLTAAFPAACSAAAAAGRFLPR